MKTNKKWADKVLFCQKKTSIVRLRFNKNFENKY